MSLAQVILQYLHLGFTHVIPLGFDHILFILSIYFFNANLKSVILQCSVFTLAHSISLGLTAAGYILPDSKIVEPLIALSIVFTSVENILHQQVNPWRMAVVFLFGLIHGMGFANALREIGLPPMYFLSSLLSFNVGVELGQITVIGSTYFLIGKWFSPKPWYKERLVFPISSIIACIALYWTIERIVK
jgi:hydrogenase/urease accessory protein HupE